MIEWGQGPMVTAPQRHRARLLCLRDCNHVAIDPVGPGMRSLLALVALAVVVPLSACDGSISVGGDDDTHRLEVRGAHTAFDLEVPQDWGITDVSEAGACGSVSYDVAEDGATRLVIEAVPTACAEAGENGQIGNGQHGIYRTVDDIPDPQDSEAVETALGSATVVTQEYFECTNSCDNWDEPVAIVTLDAPVDAGYPTLVVRGEKDQVSRADFEEIVATLAAPYVATG
jgi:hypothetical protein